MEFLWVVTAAGVPVLAAWCLLLTAMTRTAIAHRPALGGAVRPWEEEEDRTRTKRLNAIIEQEFFPRAA